MKDTLTSLLESDFYPETDNNVKNFLEFSNIGTLTEAQRELTGFVPEKVIILKEDATDKYFIEFNNNLERLMDDQKITIEEAVDAVIKANDMSRYSDINIIVDESSLNKINIAGVSASSDLTFVKMN